MTTTTSDEATGPTGPPGYGTPFLFDRGRLYVAVPLTVFRYPMYYAGTIKRARWAFPEAELIECVKAFHGKDDWLRRWPEVLATLDGLVFCADPAGMIGMGVYQEVQDAQAAGLPVGYLAGWYATALSAVDVEIVNPADRSHYARVRLVP